MNRALRSTQAPQLAGIAVLFVILALTSGASAQQPDADAEIPAAAPPTPAAPGPVPASPTPGTTPAPGPTPTAPTPALALAPASQAAEIQALRQELREDRARFSARVDALEADARRAGGAAAEPSHVARGIGGALPGQGAWAFSTYVQSQYEQHQNSSDQLSQGGTYLNQDRFLVRRGRLRLDASWEFVELGVELDGNTVNGPIVVPKRVNASVIWRGQPWDGRPAMRGAREAVVAPLRITLGLTGIPFGFEIADSPRDRVFLERSLASQSLFPGEQDLGAVVAGGVGFFRYGVGIVNGTPLGDSSSTPLGDPTHSKDFLARLGVDATASDRLRITAGVSALYGNGFHAGTPATKASTQWIDSNQNGVVDPGELVGVPARTASPSQGFERWGLGADLEAYYRTALGVSMLYGELSVATNLDRGLFVVDPVSTGVSVREVGGYIAFVQEITRYGLVGFRCDFYDPNADFLRSSGGTLEPVSQAITTFSPLAGIQLPDRARLVFEYDVVRNLLGIAPNGVPTNLPEDHFALRLQVQL